jgi:hypothetical protein
MGSILLFSILAILAMMLLLMILVVDQVRGVHRAIVPEEFDLEDDQPGADPRQANGNGAAPALTLSDPDGSEGAPLPEENSDKPDTSFGTLVSKRLWDAMTGKPMADIDEKLVEELRPRYHVLLARHCEELFNEGVENGRAGKASVPQNKHKVKGLRGSVISWIPQQHADTIYQAGYDSVSAQSDEARQAIQKTLLGALKVIATRTAMGNAEALAEKLLPTSSSEAQDAEQAPAGDGETPQPAAIPALTGPASSQAKGSEPAPPALTLNSPEMTAAVAAAAKAAMKQDGVPG